MNGKLLGPDDFPAGIPDFHFNFGRLALIVLLARVPGRTKLCFSLAFALFVRVRQILTARHERNHAAVRFVFRPEFPRAGKTGGWRLIGGILLPRRRVQNGQPLAERLTIQTAQGAVIIQNEQRSTVSAEYEVGFPRLYRHVHDRNRGNSGLETRPVVATVH